MDCPGIVFSAKDADTAACVLRNAIKIESLEDPIAPVELILQRCDKLKLREVFGLPDFRDTTHFLQQIALKKGKMGKRCELQLEEAARVVLKDWNDGLIPFYTVVVCFAPSLREPCFVHGCCCCCAFLGKPVVGVQPPAHLLPSTLETPSWWAAGGTNTPGR